MRRLVVIAALLGSLVLSGGALGVLTPGRTVTSAAPVTALSVTGRSVVWAVGATGASCGSVRLWDTGSRGLWTFGERTIVGCDGGPERRLRDLVRLDLRAPRLLADAHRRQHHRLAALDRDSDAQVAAPARVRLVGHGRAGRDRPRGRDARGRPLCRGRHGHVRERHGRAALPRRRSTARCACSPPGPGPGRPRVLAALADGRVVLLSRTGARPRGPMTTTRAVRADRARARPVPSSRSGPP